MCFSHCVDNFYNRDLSTEESTCLDRCVIKFSNINQRIMSTYIRDQSVINERRMKEVEVQMQAAAAAAKEAEATAAVAVAAVAPSVPVESNLTSPEISIESSSAADQSLTI